MTDEPGGVSCVKNEVNRSIDVFLPIVCTDTVRVWLVSETQLGYNWTTMYCLCNKARYIE